MELGPDTTSCRKQVHGHEGVADQRKLTQPSNKIFNINNVLTPTESIARLYISAILLYVRASQQMYTCENIFFKKLEIKYLHNVDLYINVNTEYTVPVRN